MSSVRSIPALDCCGFGLWAAIRNPFPAKESTVRPDLWVLIDGQVRFRRREINGYNGAFPITTPIHDKDRFLTLVSTDTGNGDEYD